MSDRDLGRTRALAARTKNQFALPADGVTLSLTLVDPVSSAMHAVVAVEKSPPLASSVATTAGGFD